MFPSGAAEAAPLALVHPAVRLPSRALHKERAATAECVHAEARNRGPIRLPVRGLDKVTAVALRFALAHNPMRAATLHPESVGTGTSEFPEWPTGAQLGRNSTRTARNPETRIILTTRPTPLQAKAFELLGLTPARTRQANCAHRQR